MAEALIQTIAENKDEGINTWSLYLYAMKSPVRTKISKKVGKIFDFLELEGNTIEEKTNSLEFRQSKR